MSAAVLYDEKCNFCKVIADAILSWDRRDGLTGVPIQSDRGQTLLASVPEERRLESFHLVDADGTVRSGGPALAELFDRLPGGHPLALALKRLPGPTAMGYEWVARNRITISKFVPGALKRRADGRLPR